MELPSNLTTTLLTLVITYFAYLFVQRRIRCRTLPPKYLPFDLFTTVAIDYTVRTTFNALNFLKLQEKYGPTYRVPSLYDPLPQIVTSDVRNIEVIMAGKDWGVGWRYDGMGPMLGRGLVTSDGDEWLRARKMMRPAFNRGNIDGFEAMEPAVQRMVKAIDEKKGGTVDVKELLYDAFMRTSLTFILGLDASPNANDGRPMSADAFNDLWLQGILGMGIRIILSSAAKVLPSKNYENLCSRLHNFVDFALKQSDTRSSSSSNLLGGNRKSMVDIVKEQARDKTDARNQLLHGMLANQDTTSVLSCNVLQILAGQPEIWEQVRREVREKGGALKTYDGIRENKVVMNILHETLRHRPVFPFIARRAMVPTTLPVGGGPSGQDPIPVGTGCVGLVNLWTMTFNPDVFGPNPETFNPDRWISINPSPREWMPFGYGPRSCLGKDKALVETGYLVCRLAEEYASLEDKVQAFKPDVRISMKNNGGYMVGFHRE